LTHPRIYVNNRELIIYRTCNLQHEA